MSERLVQEGMPHMNPVRGGKGVSSQRRALAGNGMPRVRGSAGAQGIAAQRLASDKMPSMRNAWSGTGVSAQRLASNSRPYVRVRDIGSGVYARNVYRKWGTPAYDLPRTTQPADCRLRRFPLILPCATCEVKTMWEWNGQDFECYHCGLLRRTY